jgi:type IV secretion system protein VirB11
MKNIPEILLSHILEPLDPYRVPEVEEICINRPHEAFVRSNGRFERHEIALDYEDLHDASILAGAWRRQNVNERMPLLATEMPDGARLQVVLPPCVPEGTISWTVRRHSAKTVPLSAIHTRYRLDRWNRWEDRHEARKADNATILALYDSGDIENFFREAVRLRFNLLLTGATGSGKTTMLRTLIDVIDGNERLITIENAAELELSAPNHVRLLYSHGQQGVAQVTQRDLLQAYLRMRPDRGFVGELRDEEAAYTYADEVCTGHPGSASTIHGKNAKEAFRRLFKLVKGSEAGRHMDDETVIQEIGDAVDVIVPFREREGAFEIAEVWVKPDAERRGKTIAELLE